MQSAFTRTLFGFFKVATIILVSALLLLFIAPYIMPGSVSGSIKKWTNKSINGELDFSKVRLSFLSGTEDH